MFAKTLFTKYEAEKDVDLLNGSVYDDWNYHAEPVSKENNLWTVVATDEDGNRIGNL
tara:strand:+ start:2905 stop:3075 length:171 start_codon:yes stop_codon:yes gene_type:complete